MVLSPFAPAGAVTAYPSHAFRAAIETGQFTFPMARDAGASNLFLDDVVDSLLQINLEDRKRNTEPAYNLHAYTVTAGEIADLLTARVQGFETTFDPDSVVDDLTQRLSDSLVTTSAKTDWDWAPKFDFEASAETLLDRISAETSASS